MNGHPHLQQHGRDRLLVLEGGPGGFREDGCRGADPASGAVNVICPGAIRTDIERYNEQGFQEVGTPIEYREGKIP